MWKSSCHKTQQLKEKSVNYRKLSIVIRNIDTYLLLTTNISAIFARRENKFATIKLNFSIADLLVDGALMKISLENITAIFATETC